LKAHGGIVKKVTDVIPGVLTEKYPRLKRAGVFKPVTKTHIISRNEESILANVSAK
jgi:hypothetical protein